MKPNRREALIAGGAAVAGLSNVPNASAADEPAAFIADHLKRLKPLELAANRAWWDANTSGKDEDFKRKEESQNKIDAALADTGMFARCKSLYESRNTAIADARHEAADRTALPAIPRKAGRPGPVEEAHVQGQRRRAGVQRLPAERGRQGDVGQSGAGGAEEIHRLRPPAEGLGGEQGRRGERRKGSDRTRETAKRSGQATGLRELPRDDAAPERAGRPEPDQAVRRSRRPHPGPVHGREGGGG